MGLPRTGDSGKRHGSLVTPARHAKRIQPGAGALRALKRDMASPLFGLATRSSLTSNLQRARVAVPEPERGREALAGLDAETGTVMLLHLKLALARRRETGAALSAGELDAAIVEGSARRLRPKLMTLCCILFGLIPVLFSHGTGADVFKRTSA